MKTRSIVAALVLFVFAASSEVSQAEPDSFPICKRSGVQNYPVVDGANVVWMDNRSGSTDINIYRNNPANMNDVNGILVCSAVLNQQYPAISGNTVVWQDKRRNSNTYWDIYRYLLPSGPETAVCTLNNKQENPAISGDVIVYQSNRNGNSDIYGYRISTENEFAICTDLASQSYPAVSGNIVVWQDYRSGDMDIYGRNIVTDQNIAIIIPTSWQQNAAVDGNIVVWQDDRDGNNDIYGKNLATGQEIEICKFTGEQINPAISGDVVVWEDNHSSNADIYGYRFSTGEIFAICTLATNQTRPAISGNFVVWEDDRNGNLDIYGAYIPQPVTLTVLYPNGGEDLIAGKKCTIRWQTSGGTVGSVKLEYSTNGGQDFTVITPSTANSGSFEWQPLPDVESEQCKVRVSDIGGGASDVSDAEFTIFQCDAGLTADLSGDCRVDFTDFAMFSGQWLSCGNLTNPDWCL